MPRGYDIRDISVTDPEACAGDVRRAAPILGGVDDRSEAPEGPMKEHHVAIAFDRFEAAQAAGHSPEYRAVLKIRQSAAESDIIPVRGV